MQKEDVILMEIIIIVFLFEFILIAKSKINKLYIQYPTQNNINKKGSRKQISDTINNEIILNEGWHKVTAPYSTKKDLYIIK